LPARSKAIAELTHPRKPNLLSQSQSHIGRSRMDSSPLPQSSKPWGT
jgi:hypothetical protein